jgi:hypothetical protein
MLNALNPLNSANIFGTSSGTSNTTNPLIFNNNYTIDSED